LQKLLKGFLTIRLNMHLFMDHFMPLINLINYILLIYLHV